MEYMTIKELGHVVLYVSHLKRSADFYKEVLGFREIHRDQNTALFSSGRTHHELLLIAIGGTPLPPKEPRPGLYHIGLKIGDSPEDIKKAYEELQAQHVPIVGTGDHTITHSIYILDPDGNELELYADVSEEWKRDPLAILTPVKRLNVA
jgi:catechol 2,3-dioxygenase